MRCEHYNNLTLYVPKMGKNSITTVTFDADFGLSNEEYIKDSESGEELHCRTQCGSPAYAAPELLGQKEYDKSVDVWSM